MKSIYRPFYSFTSGLLTVLAVWYLMHLFIRSGVIPGPVETVTAFLRLAFGRMIIHISASLARIAAAVAISMLLGVPLGLLAGLNRVADFILSPVAYIMYPIPKIAFLPVLLILFGLGNGSKIILVTVIIIFQIILSVRDGVKEIPAELFFSVRCLGLNGFQMYKEFILPGVLPRIFSALRTSLGISFAALFFGENYSTDYGIGYFIMNCWVMADYTDMFAGIMALSLMGTAVFKITDLLERWLCPWRVVDEKKKDPAFKG